MQTFKSSITSTEKEEICTGQSETVIAIYYIGSNLPILTSPWSPEDKAATILYGLRGAKGSPN